MEKVIRPQESRSYVPNRSLQNAPFRPHVTRDKSQTAVEAYFLIELLHNIVYSQVISPAANSRTATSKPHGILDSAQICTLFLFILPRDSSLPSQRTATSSRHWRASGVPIPQPHYVRMDDCRSVYQEALQTSACLKVVGQACGTIPRCRDI